MARPKIHDEALRAALIDRTGELLAADGPAALSLRRLAADAGTSTTAVYSLFGGKPGLVRAVRVEAFRRFGTHLAAVRPGADTIEDLVRLGRAYRESALADPHLYEVMFGRALPDLEPDEDTQAGGDQAMRVLVDAVARAVDAGALEGEPAEIALAIWASVHGLVSLELGGHLRDRPPQEGYERALRAVLRGWSPAELPTAARATA